MSAECPCCFEAITAETGQVVMGCAHVFHFRCITEWFLNQESNDLPQNCPCCRREGSEIEKLPPLREAAAEDEDDDSEYDDEDEDEEVQEITYNRQQMHDLIVSHGGIGVTDAMWAAFYGEEHEECLAFDMDDINHVIQFQGGRELTEEEFNTLFRAQQPVESLLELSGLADIQVDEVAAPPAAPRLQIRWVRDASGDWVRRVLNPEEEEPAVWSAASNAPPPDELVAQTMGAVSKIQALWRGAATRKQLRTQAIRDAAAKIQALFRGHTVRQIVNPARILSTITSTR